MAEQSGGDWLSRTLTDLRKAAGLSGTAAAIAAGMDQGTTPGAAQARLSRIETGTFPPTEAEVAALCDAYRAPAAVRSVCLLWARGDNRDGAVSSRVILRGAAEHQRRLGDVEEASREIRVWQPLLIPGLLQTEDYARAVFADRLRGAAISAAVKARQARAGILDSDRSFTFIVAEGALRWSAGPAVMRGQLAALADAAGRYQVGVIPQSRAAGTFPTHGFGLFDSRLVVVGLRHAAVLVGDLASVADYVAWFAKLQAAAVFGEDARRVIAAVAASYDTGEG